MAHLGAYLIFGAFGCSLASAVVYFLAWRGKEQFTSLARTFFRLTALFVTGALGTLLYLILTHDFSVAYVFSYSSTDLPLGYLIASLWGGQEGTFLLWVFYTSILGLIMMRTARQFERGNMFFLSLFVLSLLLIMLKKSPFELAPVVNTEGAGLNPLLQNFWMTIHPPIMFLGFSGAVFPFCFALTALVERKYELWSQAARRWTMFAWSTLGISLVMGGYWAYETLGWGGFWAWDPVENSSLIPWLFLTAQVHSLFIKQQRRGLMRFSLFVVCLTFWSVLYGTFLTRSGVLADFSVHSFVDLGINQFLVSGLLFFVLLGCALLMYRWRDIKPEPSYSKVASRSYLVTLGILILFVGGVLVLMGTSSPLLTRFADNPSNVGMNYYFTTMTPIGIALLILVGLFPAFKWNDGVSKPRLLMAGGLAFVVVVTVLLVSGVSYNPLYLALFGAAGMALTANGYVLLLSVRDGKWQPGYLSHVGLALALAGAAAANGFETKEKLTLVQGQSLSAMGCRMTFTTISDNAKGFDCHIDVTDQSGHSFQAVLPHEFPRNAEGVMKKPYIEGYLAHDLYFSPSSIERPQGSDPGSVFLKKGEKTRIGKYDVTFNRFDVANHGEQSDSVMSAAALVSVEYDGKREELAPLLQVRNRQVTLDEVRFDSGRAGVMIAGLRPEDGGVMLKFSGESIGDAVIPPAVLVMELSKKPLINLFWMGTFVAFLGGVLSMYERRRQRMSAFAGADVEQEKAATTSSTPSLQPVSHDAA